jgi:hypothetical protein
MTDRTVRATGIVALALSAVLAMYSLSLAGKARRAIDAAEAVVAKNEAWRARMLWVQDRLEREIATFKATLDRMIEEERDRARRAGRAPWRERID